MNEFLTQLAVALEFTALSLDKQGVCLIVMKAHNIPLLFEFDDHLVPNTVLLSTPILPLPHEYEWEAMIKALMGNHMMEETLSLKPDDNILYFHRRMSPHIKAKELKLLIDRFLEQTLKWKGALEDVNFDKPHKEASLKPYRFKV